MSSLRRRLGTTLISLGFDPRKVYRSMRFLSGYWRGLRQWKQLGAGNPAQPFELRLLPTLADRYAESGVASGHYFHQDLWAARQVHAHAPQRHLDVGSRVDGFIAHLLSFREVEVVDIRQLDSPIAGLRFRQADLMSDSPLQVEPADSVSCLHALEHFGLGRYGDPITPDGWRLGLRNLARLVAPGGRLYVGVPIGRPAVEFNAQRIFHPRYIVDEAALHGLQLRSFSHVNDAGQFHDGAGQPGTDPLSSLNGLELLDYGCGLYLFEKAEYPALPS